MPRVRHAVQIEPSLRPPSPENGNTSKIRRRLSAISPSERSNSKSRDRQPICKSPPSAGFSAPTEGKFSEGGTAWLGRKHSSLEMVNWNPTVKKRTLSAIQEKWPNSRPLKLISNSKRSNFENRTEWAESRGSERKG